VNIDERNEQIWKMRCEGNTLSRIAKQFGISSHRARQICFQKKARIENLKRWPPLRKELSVRVQNVLIKTFGSEEIFNHPEKLASLGEEVFVTWRNIGRKGIKQLIEALESLGYSVNRNMRMPDMKCQGYLNIGRTILRKYFDYYTKNTLDDAEYIPVVRLIIEGIAQEMKSSGLLEPNCREVAQELKAFNLQMYQNIWIEHAKEDEDLEEGPLDLEKEYESARYTFDYIYKHGKHPR
jgi:hypothetical protein